MKRTAARGGSTHFAWATGSLAVFVALIFLGGAAAMLTAREDVEPTPIAYKTTPPPRALKKDVPSPIAATRPDVVRTATTVTIAGCLESDEETFILTDASGAGAPASRSWKSGFLKKRSAPIQLTDDAGTLNLRQHVGRRVTATGTLIEREMRVLSVRRIGSCE